MFESSSDSSEDGSLGKDGHKGQKLKEADLKWDPDKDIISNGGNGVAGKFANACHSQSLEALAKKACNDLEAGEDKALRMMEKMGFAKGMGLGKHGQGRVEPVEALGHKGRRDYGHYNAKLKEVNLRWDPDKEEVEIKEEMKWLENSQLPVTAKDLKHWMAIGPSKKTVDNMTSFCDSNIMTQVISSKSVFDNLYKNEMRRARIRSNPYEAIRGAFFQNWTAVKMANLDRACNFMFTDPGTLKPGELLYFADVCAGPGGFSEYVLWRKKWRAKGFGFTLKASNNFKFGDSYAGLQETFHPYYGPNGDGDVYSPENQDAFRQLIMRQTCGKGVHFMMGDGEFSVEGQESMQEFLLKQLYLCQCLVALMIVREGGHFVTKFFDLLTPFSAGLVYLMYRCFGTVSIFKPNTSRPSNSERYLICEGKHSNVKDTIDYLSRANRLLLKKDKYLDVTDLVPHEVLQEDTAFFRYLKDSNDDLASKLVVGRLKIAAYCEDPTLVERRQADMRKRCLDYWGLPDMMRTVPTNMRPDERLKTIVKTSTLKFMTSTATKLTNVNVDTLLLKAPYDWFCMPCGSSGQINDEERAATFYMGMGRMKTFRYWKGSWVRVLNVELPPDTLVYAEMISELRGEYRQQRKTTALHILDSYMLGTEDVSDKYLRDRHVLTKMFCEALWKPTNSEFIRVRAKDLYSMPNNLVDGLRLKACVMKNGSRALAHIPASSVTSYDYDGDEPYFIVPNSVLFLKGPTLNWSCHMSRSTGITYFFNCKDNRRFFDQDKPPDVSAAFPESFENRVLWQWPPDPALTLEDLRTLIGRQCAHPNGH